MKTRSKLLAALILAVFALSACSSDEEGGGGGTGTGGDGGEVTTVSNETYVSGLCTAMGTYLTDVQSTTTEFTGALDPTASIDDQKAAVITYLDDVISSTQAMVAEVQALGTPEVGNGDEVVAAVNESFTASQAVLEDARAQVEALSTDDPVAFGTALIDLGTSLENSMAGVSESLGALDSQELSEAAAAAPACSQFASGVGTT